jgi:hypothetical protein
VRPQSYDSAVFSAIFNSGCLTEFVAVCENILDCEQLAYRKMFDEEKTRILKSRRLSL